MEHLLTFFVLRVITDVNSTQKLKSADYLNLFTYCCWWDGERRGLFQEFFGYHHDPKSPSARPPHNSVLWRCKRIEVRLVDGFCRGVWRASTTVGSARSLVALWCSHTLCASLLFKKSWSRPRSFGEKSEKFECTQKTQQTARRFCGCVFSCKSFPALRPMTLQ